MNTENNTKYWIFTCIISVVAGIIVEIFSNFSIIKLIVEFLTLFLIKIPIPIWLLILIFGFSVFLTKSVLNYLNREPEKPDFAKYTFDGVFGISWQWKWDGRKIENLVPLCPECSYQPFLKLDFNLNYITDEDFRKSIRASNVKCDNCGFEMEFQDEPEILKTKVTREIHRRLRTGEYEGKMLSAT